MMMPTSQKYLLLLLPYLSALSGFAPFSTDIYLASMPVIRHVFDTTVVNVQLTLSLFFVAFAFCQLVWGPLSDRYGRKPILIIGLVIFVVGSLFCALSRNITQLIVSRVIQAVGASSGIVMSMAIARDFFPEEKLARILAIMVSITMIAPLIAPVVGSYLLIHIGWQANFYFLAAYGLALLLGSYFLHETHQAPKSILSFREWLHAAKKQAIFVPFLLPACTVGTMISAVFGFVSSSPFIYITLYHLPPERFGWYFAVNASALILGSLTLHPLKQILNHRKTIIIGLGAGILGSVLMLMMLSLYPNSIWSVAIPAFVITYSLGVLLAEISALALKHVISHTGMASSLLGTSRYGMAAATSFVMGMLIKESAMPLAFFMLTMSVLSASFMLMYFRYMAGPDPVRMS